MGAGICIGSMYCGSSPPDKAFVSMADGEIDSYDRPATISCRM
jgi:hypothetical protein